MALTAAELFGVGGSSAVGATTGGSTFVIVPPAAVAAAGALPCVAWLLDRLVQAQVADGTLTGSSVVVSRTVNEVTGGKTKMVYTVTLTADTADLSEPFAENVDDNFSEP